VKPWVSLDEWRHGGEYFPHRGQRIFFKRTKQQADAKSSAKSPRPTILLLHGFPTSSWDWSSIWQSLAAQYDLITFDMVGYGLSSKPTDYHYSIFDQADLSESLLARLHVEEFHILAHDVGDTVAQELLARALDRTMSCVLKSVCLLNGGLFPETHRPRLVQRLLMSPLGKIVATRTTESHFDANMTKVFGRETPPSKREIEVMWALINENNGLAVFPQLIGYMRERRRHRARWVGALTKARGSATQPRIPVRLINGEADPISGRHMTERYAALVEEADIMLLKGIGHYPQIEAPELVLRGYLDFMALVPR
jgi:pimeloyl-ACP methyl ester carboxylesterase